MKPPTTQPNVLIVDDEPVVRRLVGRLLVACGWAVEAAESGEVALHRFSQSEFHLVLTDLQMPGIDGWELARRIREIAPDQPVIAMTGTCRHSVMERWEDGLIDRVLFKPFTLEDLKQSIDAALKPVCFETV